MLHGIAHVGSPLRRYVIKGLLGCGTFGQVARCKSLDTGGNEVAVKVIKNLQAYFNQAVVEVHILKVLNQNYDPDNVANIVRMLDYFVHCNHLCIVFERLHDNLFEVIQRNHYRGLSTTLVRHMSRQVRSRVLSHDSLGRTARHTGRKLHQVQPAGRVQAVVTLQDRPYTDTMSCPLLARCPLLALLGVWGHHTPCHASPLVKTRWNFDAG